MTLTQQRGEYTLSTDPADVQLDAVHAFLTASYWSPGIPRETVARAVANSIPFSLLHLGRQIGFARVITDRATFAYLADVYILEEFRGRGLSLWLMDTIVAHADLQGLRRFRLVTRDAHGLYRRYGFTDLANPSMHLERTDPDVYRRAIAVDDGMRPDRSRRSTATSRSSKAR